ncbi:MAG: hypothetical protein WAX85_02920 [Minisyncoccia bacterium]
MSNFLEKIKSFAEKIKTSHLSYSRVGIRPKHDWNIILAITSISICFTALMAYYFYIEVTQGRFFTVNKDDSRKEVRINNVLLEESVNDVNLREEFSNEINKNQISKPDPSL